MNKEKQREELASIFAHALIESTTQKDMNLLSRLNQFIFGKNYKAVHSINKHSIVNTSIELADEMIEQLNVNESWKIVYLVFIKDKNLLVGCFDTEEKANKYANNSLNTNVVKTEVH